MTRSMTAYASQTGVISGHAWVWEMRSVNARGLDVRLRLPDGMGTVEAALRAALKAQVVRGNITVTLRVTRADDAQALTLDEAQMDRVLKALDAVQDRAFAMGVTLGQPTAADVLSQRGVIVQGAAETDDSALNDALLADIPNLVAEFMAMRDAEGAALKEVLAGQLLEIESLVTQAAAQAEARQPLVVEALRASVARLLETAEIDADRLAQELALLAAKQDVTEEIDRLRAHVTAARDLLASGNAVGRKLDFLAQEFNREANTLCSKSQNAALTAIGLDLKVAVDQMREQVQNVELVMPRRGLLIILSSPSGAGKSTLSKRLRAWDPTLSFSVSSTTRTKREGEVDGKDYFFVSVEDFQRQVSEGAMLEHARVFGNYYGSPIAPVQKAIEEGRDVLFDIDWQGAQQISKSALQDNVLSIFFLPPSITELRRRLESRGQDSAEVIEARMQKSWDEISHWDAYDYVLVNDDLDQTEERLKTIITAERMKSTQQPGLLDVVRRLQSEFEDRS